MELVSTGMKVVKNTSILYIRMLVTVGVALYSTRLVLNALGIVDYGIYGLIAGVITMLSFLNSAMAVSTQRYLSFYQGKQDPRMQKIVFSNSLLLHLLIGIILVAVLETAGFFLFNDFLNIPAERLSSAKTTYHSLSLSVFFTVVSVPFAGLLISHENMLWPAIINTIEVFIKLGIAASLPLIKSDKLIFYGQAVTCTSIVSLIFYIILCSKKYNERSFKVRRDLNKSMLKELASFAGWNLFGAACGVSRTQGLAIIFNIFLGSTINAAYSIASQVSGQLNFFSSTMLQALNPQIMKSEGSGDRKRMLRLSMIASKFSFFLLTFIAVPCIFEMRFLLTIWLKTIPDYTIIFCDLILISLMANQLTIGLQPAFQATGKVKLYQIVVGTTLLLNLPIGFFLLKTEQSVYSVLVSFILIELLACALRLYILKLIAGLSILEYWKKVLLKEIIPLLSITCTAFLVTNFLHFEYRFILTITASISIFIISIYYAGLCDDEKVIIHGFMKNRLFPIK